MSCVEEFVRVRRGVDVDEPVLIRREFESKRLDVFLALQSAPPLRRVALRVWKNEQVFLFFVVDVFRHDSGDRLRAMVDAQVSEFLHGDKGRHDRFVVLGQAGGSVRGALASRSGALSLKILNILKDGGDILVCH